MPLLKKATDKNPDWVVIPQSLKRVMRSDEYVMGHAEIKMPAVVSTSTIKGIKARLVCKNKVPKGPPSSKVDPKDIDVLKEWKFDKDNQSKPIYFSSPTHVAHDLWVEMQNPTEEDAIVNAITHGLIRSKSI